MWRGTRVPRIGSEFGPPVANGQKKTRSHRAGEWGVRKTGEVGRAPSRPALDRLLQEPHRAVRHREVGPAWVATRRRVYEGVVVEAVKRRRGHDMAKAVYADRALNGRLDELPRLIELTTARECETKLRQCLYR